MEDISEFPAGEPEGEAPQVGYCATCGVKMSWPNDNFTWPDSCPEGCVPLNVQSWPPRNKLLRWSTTQK